MPPPHATRSVFLHSLNSSRTHWEVKGDNFTEMSDNEEADANGFAEADAAESRSNPRFGGRIIPPTINGNGNGNSNGNSSRPQRRAKDAAIQGLQLAQYEEGRPFSHFMDPEETRARQGKSPAAKQRQPTTKAVKRGAKATATAAAKLDLEAQEEDRVVEEAAPPPPNLASKLKRERAPTRRFADEQFPVETKASPREISALPLTWSESSEKQPSGGKPKRVYGRTSQPAANTAAAASSDTSTEVEDDEVEEKERPSRQPREKVLETKKPLRQRIQRGRTNRSAQPATAAAASVKETSDRQQSAVTQPIAASASVKETSDHQQSAATQPAAAAASASVKETSDRQQSAASTSVSNKRQAEASEPQGQHDDEEPAGRVMQATRKPRRLNPLHRDPLQGDPPTFLNSSSSPVETTTRATRKPLEQDSLTLPSSSSSPQESTSGAKKNKPTYLLRPHEVPIEMAIANFEAKSAASKAKADARAERIKKADARAKRSKPTTPSRPEEVDIEMAIATPNPNPSAKRNKPTTPSRPEDVAIEMAIATCMVQNLATSDSPRRIIDQATVTHQGPTIIQSQEQNVVEDSQGVNLQQNINSKQDEIDYQDANVQSQEQDTAKDSQHAISDNQHHVNVQLQKQDDTTKASQNGQDSPPSYTYTKDPHDYYIEELAYKYHNPPLPTKESGGVPSEELRPIPPPPTCFPDLPNTGHCKWSWDEDSRVLFADFSESEASTLSTMDLIDEKFFLTMLERDDVTVISAGLVSPSRLDHGIWNLEYISQVLNDEYFHKIRRFDTVMVNGLPKCVEMDKMISMKPCDYIQYIRQRRRVLREPTCEEKEMSFTDHAGDDHSINVETTALYMIDLDIGKLLPKMYSNFMESMRMPGVLPGGAHCMMSAITSNARPFMGPNLYITPPASFTYFHQDGHGTVDSGHLCVSGYNEIIMLRRLTERHKKHAMWLLTGDRKRPDSYFDGLYEEPHGDGLGEKPAWPTNDKIAECAKMGYCPSLCILKPGQMIHINKGRLHAFRKLSTHKLAKDDCHATLRENLVQEEKLEKEQLCISLAWDWMYRGVTASGISREVCTTLECAGLNRKNKKMSLAIPELSLLHMSRSILSEDPLCNDDSDDRKIFGFELNDELNDEYKRARPYEPSTEEICRGILPGLRHIVKHHVNVMQLTKANNAPKTSFDRVSVMGRPNADENPQSFSVDPYGVGDFFCKLCNKELSNVYFHCDGCEKLLSKDFNICEECHSGKKYKQLIQMHPVNNKKHSTINHTGNYRWDRGSRCPCKNGPVCKLCGFCSGCSCRCHSNFTLNCRFFNEESEQKLASRLELLLEKKTGSKLPLNDGSQTEERLSLVS